MSSCRTIYSIAGVDLEVASEYPLCMESAFLPFLRKDGYGYRASLKPVDVLPAFSGAPLFTATDYTVHAGSEGSYLRVYHDHRTGDKPYAVTRWDWNDRRILVEYLPEGKRFLTEAGNSLFHLGLESILLREDRLILHAAYVDTPLGGLLFSGPSGVGKSTQADLWTEYIGARLINGDRPILSKSTEGWLGWGSPYAGSSRCYVDESCPVRAIILLEQSPTDHVERLTGLKAFSGVFSGITVNSWDGWAVNRTCDLVDELISEVPVYRLSCTPTKAAVDVLYAALTGGD